VWDKSLKLPGVPVDERAVMEGTYPHRRTTGRPGRPSGGRSHGRGARARRTRARRSNVGPARGAGRARSLGGARGIDPVTFERAMARVQGPAHLHGVRVVRARARVAAGSAPSSEVLAESVLRRSVLERLS
jgi:hypothetical protein